MLCVKTKVLPSKIHGLGLFADQKILKGTIVWRFVKGFDVKIKKKRLITLPKIAQEIILRYCYFDGKKEEYIICLDDARFFNHSEKPNLDETHPINTIARRDISKGEELTINYYEFDSDAKRKLTHTFN